MLVQLYQLYPLSAGEISFSWGQIPISCLNPYILVQEIRMFYGPSLSRANDTLNHVESAVPSAGPFPPDWLLMMACYAAHSAAQSPEMAWFWWERIHRLYPQWQCREHDGYESIPINTIFRGMNIHLPAIFMFTRGTRFWPTAWWLPSGKLTVRPWQIKKNTHLFSGKQSSKPFLNARISMLIYRRLIMKILWGTHEKWSLLVIPYDTGI